MKRRYDAEVGDPQNTSAAELQLRAGMSRLTRRWKAALALAYGALTAAAAHLVFAVAGALGTAPPHALVWMSALALVAAATAGIMHRPAPLAVARCLDLRLRQLEPSAPPDQVVCAVALLETQTQTPESASAFARMAVAQAARATGRLPSRAFAPSLPTRACLAVGVMGLASVGMQTAGRQTTMKREVQVNGQVATHHPLSQPIASRTETSDTIEARAKLAVEAERATLRAQAAQAITQALTQNLAAVPHTEGLATALSARDGLQLEHAMQQLQQTLSGSTGASAAQALSAAFAQASENLPAAAHASSSANSDTSGSQANDDNALPDLQRLQKQLDDTAAACSRDPAACAQELADLAPELDQLAREEARAEAEALADQLRSDGGEDVQGTSQGPGVEAASQAAADHARPPEGTPTPQAAEGNDGEAGDQGQSNVASSLPVPSAAGVASTQTQTQDGAPTPSPSSGNAMEVPVEVPAAAPNRAELVSTTARGGFSAPAYRSTYAAYRTVIEDVLERTQVPPHRRETVRRYFHRIRPTAHPQTR